MKKIFALILALVMVASLAACAGGNTNPTTEATTPATTEATTPATTEATTPATTEAAAQVMTYAEFVAAELDTPVVVESYIQATQGWWDNAIVAYTQNEEGAYYIYNLACSEEDAALFVPGTLVRFTGYKGEWAGEVEIMDATFEILESDATYFGADDVTDLVGTDELETRMNDLVAINGLTVEASKDANGNDVAFLYKWDGSGSQGDDLYFNVSLNGETYTFTVNAYMIGTGSDSEVYKTIEALNIGDVINVEGFLYWYNAPQPHITSVTVAG